MLPLYWHCFILFSIQSLLSWLTPSRAWRMSINLLYLAGEKCKPRCGTRIASCVEGQLNLNCVAPESGAQVSTNNPISICRGCDNVVPNGLFFWKLLYCKTQHSCHLSPRTIVGQIQQGSGSKYFYQLSR